MIEGCSCLFEVHVEDGGLDSHVHVARTRSDWLLNAPRADRLLRVRVGVCIISIKIIQHIKNIPILLVQTDQTKGIYKMSCLTHFETLH